MKIFKIFKIGKFDHNHNQHIYTQLDEWAVTFDFVGAFVGTTVGVSDGTRVGDGGVHSCDMQVPLLVSVQLLSQVFLLLL